MATHRRMQMQCVYLGISLCSSFCVMTDFYVKPCSTMVGVLCLMDVYFVKKKDMLLHHMFVLGMLHAVNDHDDVENMTKLISVVMSSEIPTIFLTLNNLFENACPASVKNMNKLAFVSTFVYYRIYNYSYYLLLDKDIHTKILIHANNKFEYWEIYIALYGLFMLNLYWACLIFKKMVL